MMNIQESHANHESSMKKQPMNPDKNYRKMLIMTILSFISMYILMYAMVNVLGNVYNNLNQVYMAGLMTAPMVVIMLVLMGKMYPDKRRNAAIMAASIIAALLLYVFIRQQTAISNEQFLRSMIPHHAGAITMCERAPITDPEIKELCGEIISAQQAEINQMEAILDRLDD
jgi:cation transport ATPase